jgi:dynein heavy chain
MKPTPTKSHYLFNLRDLSRVIQGIQMLSNFEQGSANKLIRMWVHEIARVFSDRLISYGDQQRLFQQLFVSARAKLPENFSLALKSIIPEEDPMRETEDINPEEDFRTMTDWITFTDILDKEESSRDLRSYDEVNWSDHTTLVASINDLLEEYNAINQKPMPLVLFDYAVLHFLRICRILRMSRGNCLLIGVGGSGR